MMATGTTEQMLQGHQQDVLHKLKNDPISITAEDARRFSENFDAHDEHSARIISAVEAMAAAGPELTGTESLGDQPHTSILTVVKDLQAVVDADPAAVTTEVLRTAQGVVSKMQKAVGTASAPHPELEAELQDEFAKIEPKVEQGIVTKAEADHLHSLEARAHGHTEKGGLTAMAQSVVAKRERRASISEGSNAHDIPKPPASSEEQSRNDREANRQAAEQIVGSKIENEPEQVTKDDAALVQSREARAGVQIDKDSVAAKAQSLADKNEQSSEQSSSGDQAQQDKDINRKMAELDVGTKMEHEPKNITKEDAAFVQSREARAQGVVESDSIAAKAQSLADQKENRTAVEAN
ncbi:hypothetical protein BDV95DRAFT_98365 [Massariosphaeria phaeospora]|uniref:SMP domain-containing protein n=1 Tax=Massariosphaeria phaeospora TaxID=100035 RepID=A0A7C8I4U6_9PLEO|nr:hypothetical protein BDV95DRAFT_98365 [Massariosphaeria phaeospora]